jgi:hypothetical protein
MRTTDDMSASCAGVSSVGCFKFTVNPACRFRFEGIGCNDRYLNLIASGTFEQPVFETDWPRRTALQHHPGLAAGAARPLDSGQELLGRGHDASLRLGGNMIKLSVTDERPKAVR